MRLDTVFWCANHLSRRGSAPILLAPCAPRLSLSRFSPLGHQQAHASSPSPPTIPPSQRIAEEYNALYGGGWDPDQLMHIWRRHAQRGPQARKGKWTEEEDEMLLRVRVRGGVGGVVGAWRHGALHLLVQVQWHSSIRRVMPQRVQGS